MYKIIKNFKIYMIALLVLMIVFLPFKANAELRLQEVSRTLGVLGQDLEVTLTGKGFDENTRVSMSLDTVNRKSIVGSVDTPGYAFGVTVVGNYAYVADSGSGLQVINVSDPSNPTIIGSVDTPHSAKGVTVVEKLAYVADEYSGLQVIDVSDPSNATLIGSEDTLSNAFGVSVAGDYAYVASRGVGLRVIDVSDPNNPTIIGSVDTPDYAFGVTVVGNYAYVADSGSGLQVVDVSDPSNPTIIGSVETPGHANGVSVAGKYAYVADSGGGLQVIDVSDPNDPIIIGSVDTPGNAKGVTVAGKYAYVAGSFSGLQVIDVSNPNDPTLIGSVGTPRDAHGVTVAGDYAYVADVHSGLQVIDVSDPSNATLIGSVDTPDAAYGVTVVEEYAYVAASYSGLQVIDVSTPSNPTIIGSMVTPGKACEISVVGEYAYVADEYSGLQVIDVSDPNNPTLIGSVDTPDAAYGVTVAGEYAYVAAWGSGLQVIDVSNSNDPTLIGTVDKQVKTTSIPIGTVDKSKTITIETLDNLYAEGVSVAREYAYVTNGMSGLQVIDVSDPNNPTLIGSVDTPYFPKKVTVVGEYAYIADLNGLQVIDVSDPNNPTLIGSVDTPGNAKGVTVAGELAYVADGGNGLQVVDVSDPSNPKLIGSMDTPGYAYEVIIAGGYAYIADGGSGLCIISPSIEIKPITVHSETMISLTLPSPEIAGHYTLRVFNENESHELVAAVTFVQEDSEIINAKAIIVASRGPNDSDNDWAVTQMVATHAYKMLDVQGYSHEMIYYLNSDPDSNNPNSDPNIIDDFATYTKLSYAINNWTTETPASGVLIYFVGHGADGVFRINDTETLEAQELNGWLDPLQNKIPGYIIFIYDACQSGSFIAPLTSSSPEKRIIITSGSNEASWYINHGSTSFSFQFWSYLSTDANLLETFNVAKNHMTLYYQTALLEGNGNGSPNEENDREKASAIQIGRGRIVELNLSIIGRISPPQQLKGELSAPLWVSDLSIDEKDIDRVWAIVIPPDLSLDPNNKFPEVELHNANGSGKYEGIYGDFSKEGTYIIIINVERNDTYAPLDSRQTTVTQLNGDATAEPDIYDKDQGDNTFAQASSIIIDAEEPQHHNFHKAHDEDWISFYGVSRKTYKIKAGNPSTICNPVIELYKSDGNTPLITQNDEISGRDEVLYWSCEKDDIYYVKVRNLDPSIFGENTRYEFHISLPIHPSHGIFQGTLTDPSGSPLESVWIITDAGLSARTDVSGKFKLVHPAGTFTIIPMKPGYKAIPYPDQSIYEDETSIKDFVLEPLSNTDLSVLINDPSEAVTIYEGESLFFQGSIFGGKGPYIFLWDFSGGAPNANVEDPGDVTFKKEGEYAVTFIISDSDGYTAESQTVTVKVLVNQQGTEGGSGKGGGCFIESALMP